VLPIPGGPSIASSPPPPATRASTLSSSASRSSRPRIQPTGSASRSASLFPRAVPNVALRSSLLRLTVAPGYLERCDADRDAGPNSFGVAAPASRRPARHRHALALAQRFVEGPEVVRSVSGRGSALQTKGDAMSDEKRQTPLMMIHGAWLSAGSWENYVD